ncbi:hypothetical protein J4Q44_G00068840 [Coregonus suidteri]|uniref:Uncharacterized protein n=1 Tax=Coregonus suidteri TaxID=861788 RepID=A0AAN8M9M4_9TELE
MHFNRYVMVLSLSLPDSQDVQGRQFINVIDLEDGALLQELPAVRDRDVTPFQPSPPTSAQLHLLAASVTNSAPPELTADTRAEDDLPQAQPGISVASPPPAHPEPSGNPVSQPAAGEESPRPGHGDQESMVPSRSSIQGLSDPGVCPSV